jgi:hypothetical protein
MFAQTLSDVLGHGGFSHIFSGGRPQSSAVPMTFPHNDCLICRRRNADGATAWFV